MNGNGVPSRLVALSSLLAGLAAAPSCAPDASEQSRVEAIAFRSDRTERTLRSTPEREWFLRELDDPEVEYPGDQFGSAVAISETTAVVAAPGGRAVYVFVRLEDGWNKQAKLEPPMDFPEGRIFGSSLAISGDTLIVGAMPTNIYGTVLGAAYVYERSGATWSAPQALFEDDGAPIDEFGRAVAIDGDSLVVGAPFADGEGGPNTGDGAVYLFRRSGATWTQTSKLFASSNIRSGSFGFSVAISGTTVLVGAPGSPDFDGLAYALELSGAGWVEHVLSNLDQTFDQRFGNAVALDGNVAVVGAYYHAGRNAAMQTGAFQGAAYVFTRSTLEWTAVLALFAADGAQGDAFGTSVAVSGSRIMVGAPGTQVADAANSVYLFDRLQGSTARDRLGDRGDVDYFGSALGLDGDIAVVGTWNGVNGAYAAEFLVIDGGPCESNLECGSRVCVAGVCCNVPCSGACETCASGTCERVPHTSGTPSCAPYLCGQASGECPTSCRAHADCVVTHYCLDQECVERVPNGEPCTVARACLSGRCNDGECAGTLEIGARCSTEIDCGTGFCTDGYCCDQRCDGQCEACDVRGARGSCVLVTGAPHGERQPCGGDGTACSGECDGEHVLCAYYTSDTICERSCSAGEQTDTRCDGEGNCARRESYSCGGFACADDSVCRTSCERFEHCVSGHTCQQGSCEPGDTCLNSHTSQDTEGTVEDCTPYRCESGSCRTRCDEPEDCTEGSACDPNGFCVPSPTRSKAVANDGGCGCHTAGSHPSDILWTLLALFVMASVGRPVARRVSSNPLRREPG